MRLAEIDDRLAQHFGIAEMRQQRRGVTDRGILAREFRESRPHQPEQAAQLLAAPPRLMHHAPPVPLGFVEVGQSFIELIHGNRPEAAVDGGSNLYIGLYDSKTACHNPPRAVELASLLP